ncbi:MAG: LysR family transcriptional regulator [Verrucomicrobiae bacterium]|nr:LysR family transcriptional regulator [Verrucomicrobiae bacterium]
MQLGCFKVFRDLVDVQSFSKAGDLNKVSQSAVSQQVKTLETQFGMPLLERHGKKFSLTSEGEIIYEASRELTQIYEKLQHRFQELNNIMTGTIRVVTVYSIGLHELPVYLKTFLKNYPSVNIHLEYRRSNQVYEDILHGIADIGLVAFPVTRKNIKIEPFRKDNLVAICKPTHPLASQTHATLPDLAPHKFIAFEPDIPTRQAIDKMFHDIGFEIKPIMEFDNIETVKRAVEIDAGIAIVPRATVIQEANNGFLKILELTGGDYSRPLGILYQQNRIFSPAQKKFLEILKTDPKKFFFH